MSRTHRRDFLRSAAAGAALTTLPPSIQRALAIPAARVTGTIQDVQHIVVLMQENRSFDHYFGTMPGVRGFADRFPIPVADQAGITGRTVFVQPAVQPPPPRPGRPVTPRPPVPPAIAPFPLNTRQTFAHMRVEGTPHSWTDAQAAWDHGRMNRWPLAKQNHSMGYFTREDMPFQWALADAFTLCDAYHCSSQTGTNTNRLFLWSGTNDGLARGNGPSTDNSHDWFNENPADDYTWTTYTERLQAAGVSWQVYQNMVDNFTDNPLAGFRPFRDAWYGRAGASSELKARGISTRDLDLLAADVRAGRLPQVSFIVATAEGSEHPGPSSPAQGADYTAKVLDALTANPEVWARTVLFINFDENDGFFDHVPPPAPPSVLVWNDDPARRALAGASTVSTAGEYHVHLNGSDPQYRYRPYGLGPRVPMYVVSPWSRGGWVNSQVADHTSVIRFVEQRFGVREPNISAWRRAVCGDLTGCFHFADPAYGEGFPRMPATQALAERARLLPERTTPPTPTGITVPVQSKGVRPSFALPYRFDVSCRIYADPQMAGAARVDLALGNSGSAAAVLHVYDRLHLEQAPRRYTVEPGKQLTAAHRADTDGRYDLWVLGPNGFHRHYTGHAHRVIGAGAAHPEVIATHDRASGQVELRLINRGQAPCEFVLTALAYGTPVPPLPPVVARSETAVRLPTSGSGRWYDVGVTVRGMPGWSRRVAGRVETGQPSVSDPAMYGPAQLDQWRG